MDALAGSTNKETSPDTANTIIVPAQLPRCETIAQLIQAVEVGDGSSCPLILLGASSDKGKKGEVMELMKEMWGQKFQAAHDELKKMFAKYTFSRLAVISSYDFGASIAGADKQHGKIRNQNDFYALATGLFDTTGKAKAHDQVKGIEVPDEIREAKKVSWHAAAEVLLKKYGAFE